MEKQEIIEGNKLIAKYENNEAQYDPTENDYYLNYCKYHKSLDSIMPIAEKIGRLSNWNFSLDISQSKQAVAVIFDNDYKFTASGSRFESSSYATVEAIFSVVVMFLNKTKTYAEPHVQP